MSQKQILLPLEVIYALKIALLERDLQLAHARLLQSEAERQHLQTVMDLLQAYHVQLPVPLAQCTFDAEGGALVYAEAMSNCLGDAISPP